MRPYWDFGRIWVSDQKGSDAGVVKIFDEKFEYFALKVKTQFSLDLADTFGARVVGSLGYGLMIFCGD
ncbi:MAG: hypothetical protein AMR96_04405 [Candidatus Adiutrix intracellularis]|nr:MAG: hypothetical protein AMR96_04405 [Candidatus Adiutrix intracellularis]